MNEERRKRIRDAFGSWLGKEEESVDDDEVVVAEAVESINPDNHPDPRGEVECHWCKEATEYRIELEAGREEYTTRCDECGLKVWISGDGKEKYAEIHDLEEGCKEPVTISRDESSTSNREIIEQLEANYESPTPFRRAVEVDDEDEGDDGDNSGPRRFLEAQSTTNWRASDTSQTFSVDADEIAQQLEEMHVSVSDGTLRVSRDDD